MRAIIEGCHQNLLGEPGPSDIHQLYHPALPIPKIIETYRDEAEELYLANGRVMLGGIVCLPSVTVDAALRMMIWPTGMVRNGEALLGPYVLKAQQQSCQPRIFRGLGIWVPRLEL